MMLLMENPISGELYIISSDNYHYKDLFAEIARGFDVKAPKKEAKTWMLGIAWRALKFFSLFTGKQPSITKDAAQSSLALSYYSNEKVIAATGIQFKPVNQSIQEIAAALLMHK